jgi:hypothetical protein
MKYILRINPKAVNPITRKVMEDKLWEVEQTETKDHPKLLWHCGDIRVDGVPIRQIFVRPDPGTKWEKAYWGICTRGYDDAIEIKTGPSDASGN